MKKQVKIHNEVTLVGRIRHTGTIVKLDNKDALRVIISVPNDENYKSEPNNISVYFKTSDYKIFRNKKNKAIAISGHIDTKRGQKIICDVMSFIKEPAN